MEKETRNAIERATQRGRKLLEDDFAAQLEGDFDVHRDGTLAAKAGHHLSARQAFQRERIVAAIEHKRAAGVRPADAARDYIRDAAFTTLNRFVALKMLEARELVQECITRGEQSAGYREFCGMAQGLLLLPDSAGYRLYIESLFDELSTEVKVLFERRDPSSVLWPKRATFEQILEILNAAELAHVWGEDETIGWVYQFFNHDEDRKAARYNDSGKPKAPQTSRELAVRNQFFTPRYVVQFLTDNTLGRIWYEMRGTNTVLADRCEYMVHRPDEEFSPRAKKDPRDLCVLDPACGSGHFLLYAFDLLLTIYEEAHADPECPSSKVTGKTISEDYPSLAELRKAVPGLILAHNLHGVDIDPRCAQIAQLALWMRAQKAYRDFRIGRAERAQIRRSNIVLAEPLVADEQITTEFVAKLSDAELIRVFTSLVESLNLAGDLGLLLRIETIVARPISRGQSGNLFEPSENQIRAALTRFMSGEPEIANTRRRLFADDAVHGLALLGVAEKKFDVVLMNPPFGDPTPTSKDYLTDTYQGKGTELYACFVERVAADLCCGLSGQVTPREFLTYSSLATFRQEVLAERGRPQLIADMGLGVMDAAMVRAAAYVLDCGQVKSRVPAVAFRLIEARDKRTALYSAITSLKGGRLDPNTFIFEPDRYMQVGEGALAYWIGSETIDRFIRGPYFMGVAGDARLGVQTSNNEQFVRLRWEVRNAGLKSPWRNYLKGGEFCKYARLLHLVIDWRGDGSHIQRSYGAPVRLREPWQYERPGFNYPLVNEIGFNVSVMPAGTIYDNTSPSVYPLPDTDPFALLGLMSARFAEFLFKCLTSMRHWQVGYLRSLPWCDPSPELVEALSRVSSRAVDYARTLISYDEVSIEFSGPLCLQDFTTGMSLIEQIRVSCSKIVSLQVKIIETDFEIDQLAALAFKASEEEQRLVRRVIGIHPCELSGSTKRETTLADGDDVPDELASRERRVSLFPVETESFRRGCPPRALLEEGFGTRPDDIKMMARALASYWFGIGIGRWSQDFCRGRQPLTDPFSSQVSEMSIASGRGILVDDPSQMDDVVNSVLSAANQSISLNNIESEWCVAASVPGGLREWLAGDFFSFHLQMYSFRPRRAPIYWQLATPSASYSVWLYIHAFTKDTLFRVQNDYVGGERGKLAHEERRLESLTRELRDGATPAQRAELVAQESFVEELRSFLDEVKRVAPLWNPNLDDGVIINFSPLWRLTPQNKSWQRELKSTWDGLCEEKYEWAHLAMHLWPERVVPKCAVDRSLAIAHGLEDVFWVEGSDRKWTARKTPKDIVEELIRERTSPAVKSALKSLLEAPAATGIAGRGRGGRRKVAAEGENI